MRGSTKAITGIFLFECWFYSKTSYESEKNIVYDFTGIMKKYTKGFCKDIINIMIKYWSGVSYLVFKSKTYVPGDRALDDIGYKYNYWKFISFVETEGESRKKPGTPYLSDHPNRLLMLPLNLLFINRSFLTGYIRV